MVIFLAALLFASGALAVAYGFAVRARSRDEILAELLEQELTDPSGRPEHLSELVERAGVVAERVLARTSFSGRFQLMLTRAGWALRPGEFGAVVTVASATAAALTLLVTGSLFTTFIVFVASWVGASGWLERKGRKRVQKLEEQLPTVLQLLAGSLDSGSSVLHAMELVVEEGDDPIAAEFGRVVAETRVGRPLLESLEGLAQRMGSNDLDWTVEAIRIQHQTGGKLADTLRVLAGFMRARLEVRGEVRALSAEARLSAKVLTGLPILIALYLFTFRRTYLEPLYTTGMGRSMIVVALVGMAFGTLWMRRIVRVEV